ncbi:MAG TPA: helix-turn-helix domain-containing protein [Solirubrobacteraceae bacterium]|nr:helix-turn-helix domain-containing protein [Solirubrobacteraceae bacterium]
MARRVAAQQQLELEVVPVEHPEQPKRRRDAAGSNGKLGPRLALSPDEAAGVLGVSRDYLDEHVIGELRIVRRGRRILIALAELERWLDRSATRGNVVGGT